MILENLLEIAFMYTPAVCGLSIIGSLKTILPFDSIKHLIILSPVPLSLETKLLNTILTSLALVKFNRYISRPGPSFPKVFNPSK